MTHIYFVRHALPEHNWEDDRTRPLSDEGRSDIRKVTVALQNIHLDYAISSPYIRSMDTILECVKEHGLELLIDERLRERQRGSKGNTLELLYKRWENFSFHEDGGESIGMVQTRNLEALFELLQAHTDETIIVGTHGTALSSILTYFDPSYNRDSFLRIVNYMPYIIRLDFNCLQYIGMEEIMIIDKNITDYNRNYRQ